jgi:hypothetical protein
MRKPKLIPIALSVLMLSPSLFAQLQTSESLSELARKAREAKEKRASAATILTNDSLAPEKPVVAAAPYELKTIPKHWVSCAAATAELNGGAPSGRTDHSVEAKVSGSVSRSNDLWTFSGEATVKNSLTVNLPDWVNIPANPAIRDSWQKMIDALRKHEEGHVNIATEALQSLIGKTITGSGSSPGLAQQDAQRQFDQLVQAVNDTIRARQNEYDALTDHGRKQSAIGGIDVIFLCR